jgi:hypothetical protein
MDTLVILFIVWIVLVLAVFMAAVVAILHSQMLLDRLRLNDPDKWSADKYKTIGEILKENILWMLLVTVILAELVSLAFGPVRGWVGTHLIIGLVVYVLPPLTLGIVMIVLK